MYIDTHSHVLKEYYDNIDEIIDRAISNNVTKIIVCGTNLESSKEVLELVQKYDVIYGTIGFHPNELQDFKDTDLSWLEKNITNDKIVAIGEIGLDYHYPNTDKEKQIEVFKKQIEIAHKYNKPIVVHSRDSISETYNILKDSPVKGVLHCYSSSLEMAREFTKIGYLLGFGGITTFKNAHNIIKVLNGVALEYILLETDSPYLTPEPHRKNINEPGYIPIIAETISKIKKIDIKEIERVTSSNARQLFDI